MARYPNAIWRESAKHGYPSTDTHANEGVVIHSAEGSLASALGVIDGPREASWHFFVCKDGKVYQFVDTANIAWTNGSFESNRRFWGIENEGVAGEALTEAQYGALKDLVRWLFPGPYIRGQTLWEHREMTAYGSSPTACPSGRIPWVRLIADLKEDDMPLSDADYPQFHAMLVTLLNSTDPKYGNAAYAPVVADLKARMAALEAQAQAAGLKRGDTVKIEGTVT